MENKRELLLESVAHEVKMLKQHATPEELKNLNFYELDPSDKEQCIYGQMTGSCTNMRAKELMDASCNRVWDLNGTMYAGVWDLQDSPLDEKLHFVNGDYEEKPWDENGKKRRFSYLSALEGYICLKDAKVKHILEYLKDETNTIELDIIEPS